MIITLDAVLNRNGEIEVSYIIDTTQVHSLLIESPDKPGVKITLYQFLVLLQANADLREKIGYHTVNQLPGEDQPKTCWNRILDAIDAFECEYYMKDLLEVKSVNQPTQSAKRSAPKSNQ